VELQPVRLLLRLLRLLLRLREVAARMERKWKWLKTKEGRGRRL
jgi:hypothetical protein